MLPNKRIGQGSSIPQATPKCKAMRNLESTEVSDTTNIMPASRMSIHGGVPRQQETPPSLENHNSMNRQSIVLKTQPNGSCFKQTTLPQPRLSRLEKARTNVNSKKSISSESSLQSKGTSSVIARSSSSKAYIKSEDTAVNSNIGVKRRGSQVIPSRGPDQHQHSRVPSHESISSRTKPSASSERTVSLRSIKPSSSVSIPKQVVPECDEGLPEDIRHIQRELLKLHILHSSWANNQERWQKSARIHLQKRFEALKERHVEIADISYQTQELKNRSALVDWCRNAQGPEMGKKVYILSSCIHEISNDAGFGGNYSLTVQAFHTWYDRAQTIRGSRKYDKTHGTAELEYVEEIGATWQDDVNALQRRLGTLTGDLRALGSASASSNLGQVLALLHDLIIDMLTELDCLRSIESELIAQERLWFGEQIATLSLDVHNDMEAYKKTPCKK